MDSEVVNPQLFETRKQMRKGDVEEEEEEEEELRGVMRGDILHSRDLAS
jgi:hypothetical protein